MNNYLVINGVTYVLTKFGTEDEDPWDKDWHQMEQEVVRLFKDGRPFSEIVAKTGAATQTVKDIFIKHAVKLDLYGKDND